MCTVLLPPGDNQIAVNKYIIINSTNIPPIMIIKRIYKHQNLLSL